jgi:hypothetical protein
MGAAIWFGIGFICVVWLLIVVHEIRHFDQAPAAPKEHQ